MLGLCVILARRDIHVLHISDLHGWIGGHRHEAQYGDMATYQSYYDRVVENATKSNSGNVIFVDGGDACEGTGFSDATETRCSYVWEGLGALTIDTTTVGNHDMGDAKSLAWLVENRERLFGDRYVTTNVFYQDKPLGNQFKYQVLPNGLRVLYFGFLYMAENDYNGAIVRNQTEVIRSPEIQAVIETYVAKTDLVILNLHIATQDLEANETQHEMRAQFMKYNYQVPIAVLTAHTHQVHNWKCYDEKGERDYQCYNDEAGCYGRNINHYILSMDDITITMPNGTAFVGSNLSSQYYFGNSYNEVSWIDSKTNLDTGLGGRLGFTVEDFDTERGLALRAKIQAWSEELELSKVIGFSKYRYEKRGSLTKDQSLNRLWMYNIMKNVAFDQDRELEPYLVMNSGSLRDHLFQNDIYADDVYTIMPFPNSIFYYPQMLGEEINCIVDELNGVTPEDDNPKYFVPYVATEGQLYDVITDDYNAARLAELFQKCIAREYAPELLAYPCKYEGVCSTDVILREYIHRYMQSVETSISQVSESDSDSVSLVAYVMAGLMGVVIVAVVLMV